MGLDLEAFDHLAGVALHYARAPVARYGTIGKPRQSRLHPAFLRAIEYCLLEVWDTIPWGRPEALVSGGCYVEKAGRHGEGRAIDIDAIWWPEGPLITLNALENPILYLGVEAILRKHFGTVLDYFYNRAHQDHWHVDDGSPVAWFESSRSRALFAQAALVHVHGKSIDIDGWVGSQTRGAMQDVLGLASASEIDQKWVHFLDTTARYAFDQACACAGG